jgi:uncharacterized membrane protein
VSFYDTLLFLHVASAFALVGSLVVYAVLTVAGWGIDRPSEAVRLFRVARPAAVLVAAGAVGTIVFGIWLAIYVDAYSIWDGWILAAIVLWALGIEAGRRGGQNYADAQKHAEQLAAAGRDEPDAELAARLRDRRAALLTGVAALAILLVLVDMIYKPGA